MTRRLSGEAQRLGNAIKHGSAVFGADDDDRRKGSEKPGGDEKKVGKAHGW
jgi:hypothetical protein